MTLAWYPHHNRMLGSRRRKWKGATERPSPTAFPWCQGKKSSQFCPPSPFVFAACALKQMECFIAMGGNKASSDRFYFSGFQNHCRWWLCHDIKRRLLLGRKAMANLDSILKSRDVTLPTKVHLVKAMGFPVVMYRCDSWIIKKAEPPKNWCFWTVVPEKTLKSSWTARRSNLNIHWKDWCWIWRSNTSDTLCKELTH